MDKKLVEYFFDVKKLKQIMLEYEQALSGGNLVLRDKVRDMKIEFENLMDDFLSFHDGRKTYSRDEKLAKWFFDYENATKSVIGPILHEGKESVGSKFVIEERKEKNKGLSEKFFEVAREFRDKFEVIKYLTYRRHLYKRMSYEFVVGKQVHSHIRTREIDKCKCDLKVTLLKNEFESCNEFFIPRRDKNCTQMLFAAMNQIVNEWTLKSYLLYSNNSSAAVLLDITDVSNSNCPFDAFSIPVLNPELVLDGLRALLCYNHRSFPGVQLNMISQKTKKAIKTGGLMVARKFDGIRCLIYCVNRNYYLLGVDMILRKMKFRAVNDSCSVMDCELIETSDGQVTLVVLDCLVAKGVLVIKHNLRSRMKAVEYDFDNLQKSRIGSEIDHVISQIYYDVRMSINLLYMKSIYKVDGLIFVPVNRCYVLGFDKFTLKWKQQMDCTLDFQVQVVSTEPVQVSLCVRNHYNEMIEFARSASSDFTDSHGKIVECYWKLNDKEIFRDSGTWEFKRDREDKKFPNADWVAHEVVECIRTPLFRKELRHLCNFSKGTREILMIQDFDGRI